MPKKEIALSERHDSARDNGGESKDASEKRAGSGSPTLLNVDAVLNEMRRKTAEKYGNEWTIDPLKSRPAPARAAADHKPPDKFLPLQKCNLNLPLLGGSLTRGTLRRRLPCARRAVRGRAIAWAAP